MAPLGLGRHRKLPVAVELRPHEHVAAWAALAGPPVGVTADGPLYAVATDYGLRLPPEYDLLPWEEIDHAAWQPPVVSVVTVDGAEGDLSLVDGDRFADVLRVRVEASIVLNRYRRLGRNGPGLRVVARRLSETGEITTQVRYDAGVDPADPLVRAQADIFLDEVRAELGS